MPMELLVIFVALGVFVYLSVRFGYDSRAKIQSKEDELASFGLVWGVARLKRVNSPRRALARGLRALAQRLSPQVA